MVFILVFCKNQIGFSLYEKNLFKIREASDRLAGFGPKKAKSSSSPEISAISDAMITTDVGKIQEEGDVVAAESNDSETRRTDSDSESSQDGGNNDVVTSPAVLSGVKKT